MTWKPEIPDSLETKIEQVAESAGYQSKSELVRDAVRQKVKELRPEESSVEGIDKKRQEASENLKEIALDRSRGQAERRDAVSRLGDLGDDAIDSISEVAKDAKDSQSHKLDDDETVASGRDIRKRARKRLRSINKD